MTTNREMGQKQLYASSAVEILSFVRHRSDRIPDFVGPNKILSDQTFYKAYS